MRSLAISGPLLSKLGVIAVVVLAFLRAVWNPDAGFPAVSFWLLLFMAAATAAHDEVEFSAEDRSDCTRPA
jgi:hypothetical protein